MSDILFKYKLSDIYSRHGYINKTSNELIINDIAFIKAKCRSIGNILKYSKEYKTNINNVTFTFIGNSDIDNKSIFKINNNTGRDIILCKRYAIYEHDDETDDDWPFSLTDVELIDMPSTIGLNTIKKEKFNIYMCFDI